MKIAELIRAMEQEGLHLPHYLYSLFSAILAIPVLVWPVQFWTPWPLDVDIFGAWQLSASVLLTGAVVADAILDGSPAIGGKLFGIVMIFLAALLIPLAWMLDGGMLLLGLLFVLHSLPVLWQLWQNSQQWRLWPAWLRDAGAAFAIFGWLVVLGK